MYNIDPGWLYPQQLLQNAKDGLELKKWLIECLKNLHVSHEENVKHKNIMYAEIIEWDAATSPGFPPGGWYIGPDDRWIHGLESGGETNNG